MMCGLSVLQEDDDLTIALTAVRALKRIFVHFLSFDHMKTFRTSAKGIFVLNILLGHS
jgi:hypothetical protein